MESPLKPPLNGDCLTQIFPFQKYAQSSEARCRVDVGGTEWRGKQTNQSTAAASLRNLSPASAQTPGGSLAVGTSCGASGDACRWGAEPIALPLAGPSSGASYCLDGRPLSLSPGGLSFPGMDTEPPEATLERLSWEWVRHGRRGYHVRYYCGHLEFSSAGKWHGRGNSDLAHQEQRHRDTSPQPGT